MTKRPQSQRNFMFLFFFFMLVVFTARVLSDYELIALSCPITDVLSIYIGGRGGQRVPVDARSVLAHLKKKKNIGWSPSPHQLITPPPKNRTFPPSKLLIIEGTIILFILTPFVLIININANNINNIINVTINHKY